MSIKFTLSILHLFRFLIAVQRPVLALAHGSLVVDFLFAMCALGVCATTFECTQANSSSLLVTGTGVAVIGHKSSSTLDPLCVLDDYRDGHSGQEKY